MATKAERAAAAKAEERRTGQDTEEHDTLGSEEAQEQPPEPPSERDEHESDEPGPESDPAPTSQPIIPETERSRDPSLGDGTQPGDQNEYPSGAAEDQPGSVPPGADTISMADKANEARALRISRDEPFAANTEPFEDYVTVGDGEGGGQQNVAAARVNDEVIVVHRNGDEVQLQPGDYIVRDGDANLTAVSKDDFSSNYAKPEADQADAELDLHPAVGVLVFAIQRFTERPGDADNIAMIYERADRAGVDLRSAQESGRAEKA